MTTSDSSADRRLTAAQEAALGYVRARAVRGRASAERRLRAVLESSRVVCDVDALVGRVAKDTRVALNFHPDRLARDGRMVAEAMLEDGIYRSQFESGISNGGLTAFPGGDRDRWEEQLFG